MQIIIRLYFDTQYKDYSLKFKPN